jgi:hypothetical protein
MERTGKCMCGVVSYTAEVHEEISACHCGMCRRWNSGPMLSIGTKSITWEGEDNITTITSSEWAERGFCNKCGSSLFYRVTAPGKFQGFTSLAFGTLDDQSGVELTKEWFIDRKPEAYTLEGERETFTAAEVMAMFSSGG